MKTPRFWVLFFCFTLSACSSVVQKVPFLSDKGSLERELSGELILGRPYLPEELPNADLFGLTKEMQLFAETSTADAKRSDAKAEALHKALISSTSVGGRGITYSAFDTITGIDAFERRQANCISYTLLFVAMARHLGLKAEVNEVILPPTWDMRATDTYLLMRHVNAKVFMPRPNQSFIRVIGTADVSDIVVDLEMRRYRPHYKQQVISKDLVAAQFYSNRGMELAAEGNAREAFLYLRKALLMSQEPSYIWSNFGSFYRRQKLLPEAEAIYLHGLSINPRDYTIMHNLAGLYKDMGKLEQSEYYQKRVRMHRNANPYYMFKRAEEAMEKNDPSGALVLIKKAIKKEENEARFYRLAADIYDKLGDTENARHMRDKLYQLSTIRF
ncbi:tetratricopeptide repeat protein [Cellvibrio fibrivorans]|uniref:Tetratricopeptide (TPR) repeat protein n=1 Tax=Cellvibrio fibrivorans TaxID=126350 RepID=A0ABU1V277_9GAMM|nr:tetratricopeptide repeat protein [Cellvibrio fibrivorans]MDR7091541.1 tetratricopeptide (TPR) repeat protein [Cellvibrio fibrivorans]